jgi:hypothetical protein
MFFASFGHNQNVINIVDHPWQIMNQIRDDAVKNFWCRRDTKRQA